MSVQVECPWCGQKVTPEAKVIQRKLATVTERNCPNCHKVIGAYHADEKFLDMIREKVLTFKD